MILADSTISATAAGKLLVLGRATVTPTCSTNFPSVRAGLYVDGIAVPASGVTLVEAAENEITTIGVSAPVAAGDHTIAFRLDCDAPNVVPRRNAATGGVLLGG